MCESIVVVGAPFPRTWMLRPSAFILRRERVAVNRLSNRRANVLAGCDEVPEYLCHRHRNHGTCTNGRRIRVDELNEAVLQAIEEHALTPEAVEQVVTLTERDGVQERHEALTREWKDVSKRIDRLVQVIETAGDIASVATTLRDLEARRSEIDEQLQGLHPVPRLPQQVIEDRLAEWRRMPRGSTVQGRSVLQRILRGRIVFTPKGEGDTFEAPTRFDKLFSGIVAPRPSFIKGNGPYHIGPEDTFDADYGRLLARAMERLEKSPEWVRPQADVQ